MFTFYFLLSFCLIPLCLTLKPKWQCFLHHCLQTFTLKLEEPKYQCLTGLLFDQLRWCKASWLQLFCCPGNNNWSVCFLNLHRRPFCSTATAALAVRGWSGEAAIATAQLVPINALSRTGTSSEYSEASFLPLTELSLFLINEGKHPSPALIKWGNQNQNYLSTHLLKNNFVAFLISL